ncbi:MAG TPA: integrase [Pusillimonas sp.]|jgi:transposase InsO family protein|nr:integrase [Pusillimonas sp.]HCN72426.1 integrase [Pusillimonas sp.]|tara:strand:+ start:33800 stop:35062 length:1263 start_codon:yes stop_codon:yes gene_type:complete
MVIDMQEERLDSIERLEQFLEGTAGISPRVSGNEEQRQAHVRRVLARFNYQGLSRRDKGVVVRYLVQTSGYSRQHLVRLIGRFVARKPLGQRKAPVAGFYRRYTEADVRVLAQTDALHDTPSGLAVKHLFQRAWQVYGDARYERLAGISVAHLYNLRATPRYQDCRVSWQGTRAGKGVAIGVRRAPRPAGRAGFIRIDSVHQGDQDGVKGVYHINAVDCVTQWQVVATCQKISEAYLLPVLAEMLDTFPFTILGVHADNGSEYINRRVAKMLDKLNAEFTKSRPRRSNDNALVETKNGAVVRKFLGYNHIPQRFAAQVNEFCRNYLNPYLNLHRPCLFAEDRTDDKGKVVKRYPQRLVQTPLEKLTGLSPECRNLRADIAIETLWRQAGAMSDNEAAARLQKARVALFESINRRLNRAAA